MKRASRCFIAQNKKIFFSSIYKKRKVKNKNKNVYIRLYFKKNRKFAFSFYIKKHKSTIKNPKQNDNSRNSQIA